MLSLIRNPDSFSASVENGLSAKRSATDPSGELAFPIAISPGLWITAPLLSSHAVQSTSFWIGCLHSERMDLNMSFSILNRQSTLVVLAFLSVLTSPHAARCQVDAGSLSGTITDSSGAAISGAKVTLTNEDTGIVKATDSTSSGDYSFVPVKIGRYSVSAEFAGFQTVRKNNVTVDVQQKVVVDITLAPGASKETIVVDAAPPVLQTQDASVGQVIESQAINALPLNGRNFTFLAQLSAGVTQGQNDTRGLGASGSFAANGLRPAQNNYLLDGLDNNVNLVDFLNGTAYAVRPPVDAVQEFKVETNNYSAESGRSAGAVLNATIKSGTNQFHVSSGNFFATISWTP